MQSERVRYATRDPLRTQDLPVVFGLHYDCIVSFITFIFSFTMLSLIATILSDTLEHAFLLLSMQSALGSIIGPAEVHPAILNGRVAIVIGGANGTGFGIARALADAGCKFSMINRKQEQGTAALETLRTFFPCPQVDWRCYMGTLKEIWTVFGGLRDELDRLDSVACSAGINAEQYGEADDGLDRHFTVDTSATSIS